MSGAGLHVGEAGDEAGGDTRRRGQGTRKPLFLAFPSRVPVPKAVSPLRFFSLGPSSPLGTPTPILGKAGTSGDRLDEGLSSHISHFTKPCGLGSSILGWGLGNSKDTGPV